MTAANTASDIIVATFYRFTALPDHREFKPELEALCRGHGIKGTILLAAEGVNATIAGSRAGIDAVLEHLRADPRLQDMEHKESLAQSPPFKRMKVRLKKEIVTLGQPCAAPSETVGSYVAPEQWNALISDPEVLVLDTRNDYEVAIGSFRGAQNPGTGHFREFADYVQRHLDPLRHKKVAMFCTGGIRCEKASSYMLKQGFAEVYHLQGGILKYLELVPEEESLWQGQCFVFDERVAVRHGLRPGSFTSCLGCGRAVSPQEREDERYAEGVSCPTCHGQLDEERRERLQRRTRESGTGSH